MEFNVNDFLGLPAVAKVDDLKRINGLFAGFDGKYTYLQTEHGVMRFNPEMVTITLPPKKGA